MNDKQIELERQVAELTREVTHLRRSMVIGFVLLGVLLVVGFVDRDLLMMAAAIGMVLWAVAYLGDTFASLMSRRLQHKRGRDVL